MSRRPSQAPPLLVRINLTPVIDVALVLVIILLMTAPMLAVSELGLTLPEAHSQVMGDEERLNVTLGRDGRLAIGDDVIPRDRLVPELIARLAEEETQELVVIRADAGVSHGAIRELVADARAAGAARLAFATQPPLPENVR